MIPDRKILHIDMDAFYVAVEQRDNPSLIGKAIAVGGGGKRGVICSASYEARSFGVRSAQPGFKARALCPQIIFIKPDFDKYVAVSKQIKSIFEEYTALIEPLSLDEAYLDVTENNLNINSAVFIGEEIRQKIFQQTGCTASAGVSYNKFLAKTASDINKPNGIKEITPEEAIPFLEELVVGRFYGIGKKTVEKMHRLNIKTGKDLKELDIMTMTKYFGKSGLFYYNIVRGIDNREVKPHRRRKSIGLERTFDENVSDKEIIKEKIKVLSDKLWEVLDRKSVYGRTLTLKIKFGDFTQITRSKTASSEIDQHDDITKIGLQLYNSIEADHKAIRLLGLSVSNLNNEEPEESFQLSLGFNSEEE